MVLRIAIRSQNATKICSFSLASYLASRYTLSMPRNKAEHRPDGQPARKREVERRGAMKVLPLHRQGWGAVSLGAGQTGNSQDENQSI